ncbi:hypothetical protein LCGC14_1284350 [marine sediment metagenome]|uniref:Uncharacterized protein n=1 Tax=marine sediment metagenome TaxID=412755 RepID=A0A0F9KU91_9ZZZZ
MLLVLAVMSVAVLLYTDMQRHERNKVDMKAIKMDIEIECPVLVERVTLHDIDLSALRVDIQTDGMVQVVRIVALLKCLCGDEHTVKIL